MADSANDLAQLESIRRQELSGREANILQAFGLAMRPGVPGAAADAARRLDALCPPLERYEETMGYIWSVWDILFKIAASPDVPDQVHFSLLAVLQELEQITSGRVGRGEVRVRLTALDFPNVSSTDYGKPGFDNRVWENMPEIAISFDVHYRNPAYEPAYRTEELAQDWYKLAMFGARALAARILGPYEELMCTIKSGFEQDLDALPVADMMQAEWSVRFACAWLAHGSALPLLEWAQENLEDGNVEHRTNKCASGPLYHGPAIVCFERWQFWLHRLVELANQESGLSLETRQSALNAAHAMREAEDAFASLRS